MKWIEEELKKRTILENKNPIFFRKVVKILLKHDPMGIDYEVNPDEYEPEAGTLIPRLIDCSSYIDARKIIHEEFVRWFYDDTGTETEYTGVAKEIWDAWVDFGMKLKI